MIYILVFFVIVIIGLILDAYQHRRRAVITGDPTGSIWFHIQQSKRDEDEKRLKKKAAKKNTTKLTASGNLPQPPNKLHGAIWKQKTHQISNDYSGDRIKLPDDINFLYENADGEMSYRNVNAHKVDRSVRGHDYIEGYCKTANAERTFRMDRIVGMITQNSSGEMLLPDSWLERLGHNKPITPSVTKRSTSSTNVLFTGFKKADRDRLELQATALGWHVRTTVSRTLDYLVIGGNAGPTKIKEAEAIGIDIIDEDGFFELIMTGEEIS